MTYRALNYQQFLPFFTKINKKQHKLRKEVLKKGPDYVKTMHQSAIYEDGEGVRANHTNFETITNKDISAVSQRIKEESQYQLKQAGFPDVITVWRSEHAETHPKTDRTRRVVSVTTLPGGLKDFVKSDNVTTAYNVGIENVLSQFVVSPNKRMNHDESELQVEEQHLRRKN
jgi:hypothetical protein